MSSFNKCDDCLNDAADPLWPGCMRPTSHLPTQRGSGPILKPATNIFRLHVVHLYTEVNRKQLLVRMDLFLQWRRAELEWMLVFAWTSLTPSDHLQLVSKIPARRKMSPPSGCSHVGPNKSDELMLHVSHILVTNTNYTSSDDQSG